jgi:hypothetical protein
MGREIDPNPCPKSISKGFANKLCIALFAKKSRKYPSNGFANKVCNLVNFANRG